MELECRRALSGETGALRLEVAQLNASDLRANGIEETE